VTDSTKSVTAAVTITPPPTITSVSVLPASATLVTGQTQQFSAQVAGTGNFSMAVTWKVNDISGGSSSVGMITSAGLYTAPAAVPNPAIVTVKAVSVQDPTKSGAANVTVNPPPPVILGISPTVAVPGSGQFTLTVTGSGFVSGSSVLVNGQNRVTTLVSSTVATAMILASDVAVSGNLSITVQNTSGISNSATLVVGNAVSVGQAAALKVTAQNPADSFGVKVKNLGNITGVSGQGDSAVGITSASGIYVVFNPENRFGAFTSDQIGTTSLPGFKITYSGTASADIPFFGLSSCGDVDGDGINDICVYNNIATSDPVNKWGAGTVFVVKGGSYLATKSALDLADSSLPIVRLEGAASGNFAGQSLADGKDLNGDGMSDIAFSAPGYPFASPTVGAPGAVYVVYGRTDFFANKFVDLSQVFQKLDAALITRDTSRTPTSLAAGLGSVGPGSDTIAFAGDLTGDGFPELLIGDPAAQNQTPNTQKVYVVFGGTGLRGTFFVEDIGRTFSGATYFTDRTVCQSPITFCGQNRSFGQTVSGRNRSVMLADPSAFVVAGASGMVFVSEQLLANGQIVDVRLQTQNLQASSLWSYLVDPSSMSGGERLGFTLKDAEDFRLVGAPIFGSGTGRLFFVPSSQLSAGNNDAASIVKLSVTGESGQDAFSVGFDLFGGGVAVGAPNTSGVTPSKFYFIPKPQI
jgi:hypothetical protein